MLELKEIVPITITLFAVIDILGSVPVIINLKKRYGQVKSLKTTLISGTMMVVFLFAGDFMLGLIGLDKYAFAVAGSVVIFLIGLEMILGHNIFKPEENYQDISVVPLAFPLIAGAGTLTTLLSMKANYHDVNILIGIFVNLLVVYITLRFIPWLEQKLGDNGVAVMRRMFGIILIAIAIKIFKTNLGKL